MRGASIIRSLLRTASLQLMLAALATALLIVGCDSAPAPAPTHTPLTGQETVIPPGQAVDTALATPPSTPDLSLPTPTPVTATSTGEAISMLAALPTLKERAIGWERDVRLALLVNVRPGQQSKLLGVALGDPDVFEATPQGLGKNWTLVAVSPMRGAVAVSMDGKLSDLTAEGAVTGEMVGSFSAASLRNLELDGLDIAQLRDSVEIWNKSAVQPLPDGASLALLTPVGFNLGPLATGGASEPILVYQLFSAQPGTQLFAFFDAYTGNPLLNGSP